MVMGNEEKWEQIRSRVRELRAIIDLNTGPQQAYMEEVVNHMKKFLISRSKRVDTSDAGAAREDTSGDYLVEWLDKQRPSSVVFVSFGSESFLLAEQITELALATRGHRVALFLVFAIF
ncbi:hypothetical protein SUGI_0653350 [Cryptomeria japonica]|nr:hypothetical protein SUGI_0653350 [Cryptomeria japonica]